MLATMARQENHLHTIEPPDAECIRGCSEGSLQADFLDRVQVVNGVEPAPSDHADTGRVQIRHGWCLAHGWSEVRR